MSEAIEASKVYQCSECGLHYDNELAATACETWCKKHQSCNWEIAQFALERKKGRNGKAPIH